MGGTILDYEAKAIYNEGLKAGEEIGMEKGQKKGEEIGRKKGEEIGRKKGEEIGQKKGEEIGGRVMKEKILNLLEEFVNGERLKGNNNIAIDLNWMQELISDLT